MVEKIQKLPHPGLRNLKTALAATFCIVLYHLLGREEGVVLACIGVFICMQDSVDKSWKMGRDRGLGAILGGILGSIVGMVGVAERHLAIIAIAAFLGIVIYIFISNLLKIAGSIVMGLATYSVIVFGIAEPGVAAWHNAFDRTLDTVLGIAIGVVVNMLVFRPRPEQHRGEQTINPVFHYEKKKRSNHKTVNNASGKTAELYIYPEDAMYKEQNFDFRISMHEVQTEQGALLKYPGYKRRLILVDGKLRLNHKEHHEVTLGQYEQDLSLGEWDSETKGKHTVLKLLTKGELAGKMEILRYNDKIESTNGKFASFYALEDGVKLYFENEAKVYKEELLQGDHVIVSWFENGSQSYQVEVRHEAGETDRPLIIMVTTE